MRRRPPRRAEPTEQQIQASVLELLAHMPRHVAWAYKVPVGSWIVVRPDAASGLSARQQLAACVRAGLLKANQIGWIQGAPEGVLDIACQLTDGTHGEIEIKKPGQKPTREQQDRIQTIRKWGGFAMWSDDPCEIQEKLEGWMRAK